MTIKKNIPNLITLGNLLCGVIATWLAIKSQIQYAAFFICLGIVFDFFDGLSARLLKVSSDMGKELDSLADLVTSGIAPAFIALAILQRGLDTAGDTGTATICLSYLVLLMPLFAAYRLAKFNLDEEQHHSFKGLPTPANALIWVGIALALPNLHDAAFSEIWRMRWIPVIVILSLVLDILMVGNLPMFSLKFNFKDMSWRTNKIRYIFLTGCAIVTILMLFADWQYDCTEGTKLTWLAISLSIVWYIILSIIKRKETKNQINN